MCKYCLLLTQHVSTFSMTPIMEHMGAQPELLLIINLGWSDYRLDNLRMETHRVKLILIGQCHLGYFQLVNIL